jgi:hypothetical protein
MGEQARRRLADTDGRVVLGDLEDFNRATRVRTRPRPIRQ